MSKSVNVHATCIRVAHAGRDFRAPQSAGVLLLGGSGTGKSDLALRLIGRGAQLVADDRTDLSVAGGRLIGRPPKSLAGLMEIRGVGIVEMPYARRAAIALVINLTGESSRLPARKLYVPPRPLALAEKARPALFCISAFEDSAPDKILAAVAALHNRTFRKTVKSN